VESEHVRVEYFPGIRTEQLRRVTENRDLGSPDTLVIHVGTNDLGRTANLDYVKGDVYALVNKAKTKFPQSRLVLSSVLRSIDVSWRRIQTLNGKYDWIAKTLGITFVDSNGWIENWDFDRDGLHINRSGARRLSQLFSRVCGFGGGGQNSKE
jgi:lysophospholipase L1-like esterase